MPLRQLSGGGAGESETHIRVWTFLTAWKPRLGHALRRVRVFKEAGKLSRRSRDEEAHSLRHPALKYRAKVTTPLRGDGESETHRTAGGGAAGGVGQFSHTFLRDHGLQGRQDNLEASCRASL